MRVNQELRPWSSFSAAVLCSASPPGRHPEVQQNRQQRCQGKGAPDGVERLAVDRGVSKQGCPVKMGFGSEHAK